MAISTASHGPAPASPKDQYDTRVAAFCSSRYPGLFHAFAYANDIWKPDPFDVESIHRNAREQFQRIIGHVLEPSGLGNGRILLLLGESGSGKTHLMRAFRNQVHSGRKGYCGYLQMTAFTGQYGRYVLNNLIDSLDKPYDECQSLTTGLMRLSTAMTASCHEILHSRLEQLRDRELDQTSIDQLIAELADSIIVDDRFNSVDVYLIQALLYLQSNDPPFKARVLKYLRCEELTERDRRMLGGIIPCTYSDAPQRTIERLGSLIWAVEQTPLVICVDQLEDVFDLDEAAVKFRRAMATLCDIVSRVPSAIVVIACLDNFYDELKKVLTRPIVDRVQNDPPPISLDGLCDFENVRSLIGERLKLLYKSAGISFEPNQPTYPLPDVLIQQLAGLRPRDVLGEVHRYRERCIEKGKMATYPFENVGSVISELEARIVALEQAWNEFHSTFAVIVPVDEVELAVLLAAAIRSCSEELPTGQSFAVEADKRMVVIESHGIHQSSVRILAGVCNKAPQGGVLARQIDEVVERTGERTPVIVRSSGFPANPKAAVSRQLDQLISTGGRKVVVQDSDWRVMMALSSFQQQHGVDPSFTSWLKQSRPLTTLTSVRTILDLDTRGESKQVVKSPGSESTVQATTPLSIQAE
jgi:AAA ATPase domain